MVVEIKQGFEALRSEVVKIRILEKSKVLRFPWFTKNSAFNNETKQSKRVPTGRAELIFEGRHYIQIQREEAFGCPGPFYTRKEKSKCLQIVHNIWNPSYTHNGIWVEETVYY